MDFTPGLIRILIKEPSSTAKCMAKDYINGQMEENITEST